MLSCGALAALEVIIDEASAHTSTAIVAGDHARTQSQSARPRPRLTRDAHQGSQANAIDLFFFEL